MSINQPGDVTVIAPISVPGDANAAVRAASVLGGFVAVVDTTERDLIPSSSRKQGMLVHTNDGTFYVLGAGLTNADWAITSIGGDSSFMIVADNTARNAIPSGARREGMLVYSKLTKVYYSLNSDLTTWTFFSASHSLALQTDWYINASTGNDNNDGKVGNPLATVEELTARLNPNGAKLVLSQNTTIHITTDTYNFFDINLDIPIGSNYIFKVLCDYTSSAPITLSGVTNTVGSATPTRGSIQTAAGTFVDKARIRSTSGAAAGAITYVTGLTSSTNAFVKTWFQETTPSSF